MANSSRIGKAWEAVREAGGSIIGPQGENLTQSANGQSDFVDTLRSICPRADLLSFAVYQIEKAAEEGKKLDSFNKLPFTSPKCYSKPIVQLNDGCDVQYDFIARNGKEEDCADGK